MTIPLLPVVEDVDRPRAWGYHARINNLLVQLATNLTDPTAIVTADATPQRIDTSELAEDVREDTGFRYSRNRLDGGGGLDFLHSPDRLEDATRRFWDSKGVDVFSSTRGDEYRAELMHEMSEEVSVGGSEQTRVAQIDGQVYYTIDAAIWEEGVTPARHTLNALPNGFVAMGNSLYTNDAIDGVQRFDPPSFTPVSIDTTTTYGAIWAAKSRIFAKTNNLLFEAASTPILLLTLPPADNVVDNGLVDAGSAVVALTTSGTVYLFGLDASLNLVNTGQYSFMESEIPAVAAFSQGVLGIATAEVTEVGGRVTRFYTAEIRDDGSGLDNVDLVYQLGARASTGFLVPRLALGTRDSIYILVFEDQAAEATMWRYYLPTGGYARAHTFLGTISTVMSAVEIDDRMWLAASFDGLYKEQDTYVASGYVIGPAADFFSARSKQWVSGTLAIPALPAGTEVNLFDSTNPDVLSDPDHTDWSLALKVQVTGETEVDAKDLTGRQGRYHVAQVELNASADQTLTPGLRSYSFRAFPSSDRDTIVRLPVNVSDQFEAPGKRAMTRRGRGLLLENALRALEGNQVVCEIYALQIVLRGILERVEEPIMTFPERGSPLRVMFLTIRGEDIAGAATGYGGTSSGASYGQDMFTIPQYAVGELS